jgi:hypothetical protein
MSEEGQRAESDVKTVAEILKSEGNDELKFGLLISLIKVNQASSKDVVNTVLHLVSLTALLLIKTQLFWPKYFKRIRL